jgi:hypothetical protein
VILLVAINSELDPDLQLTIIAREEGAAYCRLQVYAEGVYII